MELTWSNNCDIGGWLQVAIRRTVIVRVNGTEYVALKNDISGLTLHPSDDAGVPIPDAPIVKLPWPQIESLHIY